MSQPIAKLSYVLLSRSMSQPILGILKNQDLRRIQEDPLGKQARQLDRAYPGAHAETETAAVLRPCNGSDSRQLW